MKRRHILILSGACALLGLSAAAAYAGTVYEAFTPTSFWRMPSDAAPDPNSAGYMSWLQSQVTNKYVVLRATAMSGSSSQGTPVYFAKQTDPHFSICHNPNFKSYSFAPQATDVAVPATAQTDATDNDKDMIVYNNFAHRVFWFTEMQKINGNWCAFQMSVYDTTSNGIEKGLATSTSTVNWGHHGINPITQAVRWAEVKNGSVPHVMEVYIPNIGCHAAVWPLDGNTYCTVTAANAVPAGAVLRIKPSVDLSTIPLNPYARVIAQALQTYGAIVGDHSGTGNAIAIKLEDTATEGKGNLWADAGLKSSSLSAIPLSDYQIDTLGANR
jgi:hypothetical protein